MEGITPMIHLFLVLIVLLILFLVLGVSVMIGRRCGRKQLETHSQHKLEVVGVAESAVFGLLGLLIAFTFSGAYDRYETKKVHIVDEANVFDSAYELVDLLPLHYQHDLRVNIRKYLDLHIASYNDIPFDALVDKDLEQAIVVQHKIWSDVVIAAKANPGDSLTQEIIPAVGKMFDTFHAGLNMTLIHPPIIIFVLLIALAALGAFLVGFSAAENQQKHSVHVWAYVLLTALIIYIIINLEYPRVGFIRINSFDQMLQDVREDMNDVLPGSAS
jgi:hypothetical protein